MLKINNNETLGQYITRLRNAKGYSQRKLGLVSGVSNTTINRIENGETPNPDLATLKALAESLGIDETYLLKAAGYIKSSEQSNEPGLTKRDLVQIEKDLAKMIEDIQTKPEEGFSTYDGETEIDEDEMEILEDAFNTALKIIKKLNKATYTPNKYKNKNKDKDN
jgi:transcriptional regulator with XRE-family HTH domain